MLSKTLVAIGGLLSLWGVVRALSGGGPAIPVIANVILMLALIAKRFEGEPIRDDVPGPQWQRMGEQFTDPKSGRTVAVYFHLRTGERRYFASTGDDAAA